MRDLFQKVSEKLDGIDFDAIWPGFRRRGFALYDSKNVFFKDGTIPWDMRFMGNTAADLEGTGRFTAIWNVETEPALENGPDVEILAANMVHEMFHAHQYENGENRFPNDLAALMYPYDVINAGLKYEENRLLADAFETNAKDEKEILLRRFCACRHGRGKRLGAPMDCEYLTETAEGMAEYAGCRALRMLSEEKYAERTRGYTEKLRCCDSSQMDIRRMSYFSGALFLLTAHDAGISFHHLLQDEKRPVFHIVMERLGMTPEEFVGTAADGWHPDHRIAGMIKTAQEGRKAEVEAFLQNGRQKTEGAFYISGYDPMNMIRWEDYIFCRHFIRLTDEATQNTQIFRGQTLLEMAEGSTDRVMAYYR